MPSGQARRRADWPSVGTVTIQFDGTQIEALPTDTVASALIASGIRAFASNSHDGAPRGGFCFVGRCSDCLVIVDGQPGTMACRTPVTEGMRVERQQGLGHWPDGEPA
ncbi:MAG: (2Fe-2S)-binding protein [Chloroflexota bacterium]|nr:(2Fe-2S)-binding protein [Chloroflexota bacterium]